MSQISLIFPAAKLSQKEAATEDVAWNCLGFGETSPLNRQIVTETSLGNSVSTSTMFFNTGGAHFLRFNCPTENISKIYISI